MKEIHQRQGFDYSMPNLDDPVFTAGTVAEDGDVQMAAFLKVTAEAYLFVDPKYSDPLTRWKTLLRVHEAVRWEARQMGLSEVTCWVPPNLSKAFHRRLSKLGWQEEPQEWKRRAYHLRKVTL